MAILRNEIVIIKPVDENVANWIPEGKDGRLRWENTEVTYDVPTTLNGLARILNKEEQDLLEKEIDSTRPKGWLSPYAKDNVWAGRNKYKLDIPPEGLELDLSDPIQYIKYKIALAQSEDIAPAYNKRLDRKYYFYLETLSEIEKGEDEKIDKMMRANEYFSKIKDSRDKLRNLWLLINKGDTGLVPIDIKLSDLKKKVYNYLTSRLNMFLTIIDDDNYKYRVMFYRALETGTFVRTSSDIRDSAANGKVIGTNMTDSINYIKKLEGDEEHKQDFYKFIERLKN